MELEFLHKKVMVLPVLIQSHTPLTFSILADNRELSCTQDIIHPRKCIQCDTVFSLLRIRIHIIIGTCGGPMSGYPFIRLFIRRHSCCKRAPRVPYKFPLVPPVGEADPKVSRVCPLNNLQSSIDGTLLLNFDSEHHGESFQGGTMHSIMHYLLYNECPIQRCPFTVT